MLLDAQDAVASLVAEKSQLQSEIDKERTIKKLAAEIQEELNRAKMENDKTISKLSEKKSSLIKDLEKMAVSGHEEFHKIINQAKAEAQEIKQNSLSEASLLQQTTTVETKRLRDDAEKALEKSQLIAKAQHRAGKSGSSGRKRQTQARIWPSLR